MSSNLIKVLVIVLVALGEGFAIFAEMWAAKHYSGTGTSFWQVLLKMFLVFAIGGSLLIAGYMFGLKAFKNIWIVSVTSITSIVILEPILAYFFLQQVPTTGATIGFILGVIGLFVAVIF